MQFYIVDVFAEKKYAGNQLAVIRGANALTDKEMQELARETNFSETAFILSDEMQEGAYVVRIFTPEEEVPFAGHPALGTAYIIRQEIICQPVERVSLDLKYGRVTVLFDKQSKQSGVAWLQSPPPMFGEGFSVEAFSKLLGVPEELFDERFPIQEVSTGLPVIIVPLKNLEAVRACKVDLAIYYSIIAKREAKSIHVFAPEAYEQTNDINSRNFCDYYEFPEDPATGSANTCLAAYLSKYRYYGAEEISVRAEQGYEIKRPSVIYLVADSKNILVGGKVSSVARGELV